MFLIHALAAMCLTAPVAGPVAADFAPAGRYEGHWGIDYSVPVGTPVHSPASGLVTFAGSVAGMRTVTVEPVPGFKVSVSYLAEVFVKTGDRVARGEVLGLAGTPHGSPGVHLSTRIEGRYVDPWSLLGCRDLDISRALRLVTPPQIPPRRRRRRTTPEPTPVRGRPNLAGVRTGILGGTFDPVHIAHLHTAECALHQLDLDRVLLLPAGSPWQKAGREISPVEDRLTMCRLAIEGIKGIEVDEREAVRQGPTFTIDTLETFPDDEELFLILGADAAAGLPTWHRWEEVVERVTVAVAPRPDAPTPPQVISRLVWIEMGLLEVSGTEIRRRAAQGRPYRFLVTTPVFEYAEARGLYAEPAGGDMVTGETSSEESP